MVGAGKSVSSVGTGGGKYRRQQPDASGVLNNPFFPGLRLTVPALLRGNFRRVLLVLQQSLDSEEHRIFVQRLQSNTISSIPPRKP